MRPHWHPLSTLLLADPPTFVTPGSLKLLLAAGGTVELTYAGDRMWPAVRHGQRVAVGSPAGDAPAPGTVAVVCPEGIPDLLRIDAVDPGGRLVLRADADPDAAFVTAPDGVVATARLPRARVHPVARRFRRLWVELGEAMHGAPRAGPAESVLRKYDAQAPMYAAHGVDDGLEPRLADVIRSRVRPGGTIVVVGSGVGRECFALARAGWRVRGIDFAPEMVRHAREGAASRQLDVSFVRSDLRRHREKAGSVDGVLFTYDVYSFVRGAKERIAVLREMGRWLAPGGVVLLSARRVAGVYERLILSMQWLRPGRAWGESHTRYIGADGVLRRSFVHYFSEAGLRREAVRAGFRVEIVETGHAVLTRARDAARSRSG